MVDLSIVMLNYQRVVNLPWRASYLHIEKSQMIRFCCNRCQTLLSDLRAPRASAGFSRFTLYGGYMLVCPVTLSTIRWHICTRGTHILGYFASKHWHSTHDHNISYGYIYIYIWMTCRWSCFRFGLLNCRFLRGTISIMLGRSGLPTLAGIEAGSLEAGWLGIAVCSKCWTYGEGHRRSSGMGGMVVSLDCNTIITIPRNSCRCPWKLIISSWNELDWDGFKS